MSDGLPSGTMVDFQHHSHKDMTKNLDRKTQRLSLVERAPDDRTGSFSRNFIIEKNIPDSRFLSSTIMSLSLVERCTMPGLLHRTIE
jgi:hypothetical protein